MNELFREGAELLKEGKEFVYAAIISKNGSAPSGVGARMIVLPDRIIGTIGGGGVEADVIDYARDVVMKNHGFAVKFYDLKSKEQAVSEFICGGDTEVLVYYMDPEVRSNFDIFNEADKADAESRRAWLVYAIDENAGEGGKCSIVLSVEDVGIFGEFEGSDKVVRDMINNPIRIAIHGDADDGRRYVVDQLNIGGIMYLLGAGHVSKEVARLATGLDFNVTVIDDREEFANESRFPGCKCLVIDSFENMPELEVNSNTYILVITRGHLCDSVALKWALTKDAKYLGMIGSLPKRDKIYENLIAEGSDPEKIKKVHSPIGLKIGAKTPAEIAVSIMAEIIQCRYEQKK